MEIEAQDLTHSYGELRVLEDVSFRVADGEVLAVIGPSGCGKSTLLGLLGGLLEPARGRVLYRGEAPPGCLNPFTYVFQDFALLPWRTVEGNVALPLEGRLDASERRRRVGQALRRTGLEDFAGTHPGQLSGGMRQRVGIARALAVHPGVLLMDEPLSALDSQTRHLLREDLVRLWKELGPTTVYVTHNLAEAAELADTILVLSRRPGRVRATIRVPASRPRSRSDTASKDLEERLWRLLRDEALDAALELQP